MLIKVLNINIHKGLGWHNLRPTFRELDANIREMRPDLIFFQEILGRQAESLIIDTWPHYSYGQNVAHPQNHYGNAILSKFPIIYSENFDLSFYNFERRGLLHSIIAITDTMHIHLLCVHLGLFVKGRDHQIEHIVKHIQSTISANDPIILAGDFNDWTSRVTKPLIHGLGLQEAFLNFQGTYAKTFPSWAPLLKLDRLYFRDFEILFAQRLIQKSWRSISDHIGLEVDLELIAR